MKEDILAFLAIQELINNPDFKNGREIFISKAKYTECAGENFSCDCKNPETFFVDYYGKNFFFKGFEPLNDVIFVAAVRINDNGPASFFQMINSLFSNASVGMYSGHKVAINVMKATYAYVAWTIRTKYSTPVHEYIDYIFSMAQSYVYQYGENKNIAYQLFLTSMEYADFMETVFN